MFQVPDYDNGHSCSQVIEASNTPSALSTLEVRGEAFVSTMSYTAATATAFSPRWWPPVAAMRHDTAAFRSGGLPVF